MNEASMMLPAPPAVVYIDMNIDLNIEGLHLDNEQYRDFMVIQEKAEAQEDARRQLAMMQHHKRSKYFEG